MINRKRSKSVIFLSILETRLLFGKKACLFSLLSLVIIKEKLLFWNSVGNSLLSYLCIALKKVFFFGKCFICLPSSFHCTSMFHWHCLTIGVSIRLWSCSRAFSDRYVLFFVFRRFYSTKNITIYIALSYVDFIYVCRPHPRKRQSSSSVLSAILLVIRNWQEVSFQWANVQKTNKLTKLTSVKQICRRKIKKKMTF